MGRISITEANGIMSNFSEDRDGLIKILLKRYCTYEEAMDYLLSAIIDQTKDDILGELASWDGNIRKLNEARKERRGW